MAELVAGLEPYLTCVGQARLTCLNLEPVVSKPLRNLLDSTA